MLVTGSEVVLSPHDLTPQSSATSIGVSVPELVESLQEGDKIALGDGGVSLIAEKRQGQSMKSRVLAGGKVQGRPGVTAPASRLALKTPTPDDLERLEVLLEEGIESVAVSFVRTASDLVEVRALTGRGIMVCAKMETPEALEDIDNILQAADSLMVARGDLGVRVALEEVPHIQKKLIRSSVAWGRPVITATQMLESMISSPVPTRAEVTDVANAVFDGTSAVMLSGESAVGIDPVNAVATMARIARRADARVRQLRLGAQPPGPELCLRGPRRRPDHSCHWCGGVACLSGRERRRDHRLYQHGRNCSCDRPFQAGRADRGGDPVRAHGSPAHNELGGRHGACTGSQDH